MTGIDSVILNFSPAGLRALNAILAVLIFSIALDLRLADFYAFVKSPKPLIVGLISQFVLLPVLTFLLVIFTAPHASIALGLILVGACPGGIISNYITHRANGNTALSVSMTAFATVGAVFLTPLNFAFWGGLYEPTRSLLREMSIDPVSVFVTITFMLALPLTLGIFVNNRFPDLANRLRRPMQALSQIIFIGFVIIALAMNWQLFLHYFSTIAGLVMVHNACALLGGFGLATLFALNIADRRAVTIETGIQNSGLSLVLIFSFFGGLGGMALAAAFWGVWHVISGIALALYLSKRETVA